MNADWYRNQPYVQRIEEMYRRGELDKPGHVGEVAIAHEPQCPRLRGEWPCCCDAAARIYWRKADE